MTAGQVVSLLPVAMGVGAAVLFRVSSKVPREWQRIAEREAVGRALEVKR